MRPSLLPLHSLAQLQYLSPIMMDPDESTAKPRPGDRLQWQDEETATKSRPRIRRGLSQGSLSVHSVNSTSGPIDPSAALPIQYRTL